MRTFLEVAATGSFAAAADRLYVTQSAVSLRVRRLEDSLGRPLFLRSKAGAELTPAGVAFERYAISLLKIWEEARQQIAIPEGFTQSLSIGAQYSLWPRLGFTWVDALRSARPHLSIRAEIGMPDRLTRFLSEGVIQAALIFTPQLRPGLTVERVLNEDLVLVAGWPDPDKIPPERYVFFDWGTEFVQAHATHLPDLTNPGLTFALGALGADYLRDRGMAGYLPARSVKPLVDAGALHLVPDAPVFPYPAWVVWRDDLPEDLAEVARRTLRETATRTQTEQSQLRAQLEEISEDDIELLGEPDDLLYPDET